MIVDIQEIINRLEVVFNESTLGDIPFIQRDLREIKLRMDELEESVKPFTIYNEEIAVNDGEPFYSPIQAIELLTEYHEINDWNEEEEAGTLREFLSTQFTSDISRLNFLLKHGHWTKEFIK